jgi:DNA-binding transcriptional LysR family regulator
MEDRLQKFAHLVDAGSFTKAARDLHISQPALSMSMQKLERELHVSLYIRGTQPLAITPAGRQAYKSAKELDASLRTLRVALSEIAEREITLSIGMIDSVADIMLANKRTVKTLESQAKVSLVINNSRYLLNALARGDIDVAIVAEQSKPFEASLHAENIGAEPLVVVVHAAMASKLAQEYANGLIGSFISYDQPSHTHAMIEQFFALQGIYISPQFYSSSPDVIHHLVAAQKGAAALPYRKVRKQLQTQQLEPIARSNAVIPRRITVVTRRNYQAPHLLQSTLESLRIDLAKLLTEASVAVA